MSAQRLDEEAIFDAACKLKTPTERSAYLEGVCGADVALRQGVEELLQLHEEAGAFLDSAPIGEAIPDKDLTPTETPGTVIGRYELIELIGEGGFGAVYRAEQQEPVRRTVALKIIKLGMDTRQVIARFEVERQALAMMDHPHIAKVLDAGATETGRPYFVMELVRGVPITEYCDAHKLTTQDRIHLFIDVCHAVQHAHQKGIIHRDIKPTNVMVSRVDGKSAPKVIDFGIAKATGRCLTEKTLYTSNRQFVGTPQYMSPEQAAMSGVDVDTRSDIYSLGVLLYELLVGTTPFDPETLLRSGYDKMCRIISETEPPTPSKRLSTIGAAITTVSEHRQVQPAVLNRQLRGDLDWIVMRALEKKPDDRYATAKELSDELVRFLAHKPIRARKPSVAQRVAKWSRRHSTSVRFGAGMLAVTFFALLVTAVLTSRAYRRESVQRRHAQTEAARSKASEARARQSERQARDAVDRWLVRAAEDLKYVPGAQQIRRHLLEDALEFYDQFLEQNDSDPQLREATALAWRRIGAIHTALGDYDDASAACCKAITLLQQLRTEFPAVADYEADLAASHMEHAGWLFQSSRHPEGLLDAMRKAVRLYEKLVEDYPRQLDYVHSQALAYMYLAVTLGQDHADEAGHYFTRSQETWATFASQFEAKPQEMITDAWIHHSYGEFLGKSYRLVEAEDEVRKAITLCHRAMKDDASNRPGFRYRQAQCASTLGCLMNLTGRFEEGERFFRQAGTIYEEFGEDLPTSTYARKHCAGNCCCLSNSLLAMGRTKDAEETLRKGLGMARELVAALPDSSYKCDLGRIYFRLGTLLHHDHRLGAAHTAFTKAREQFQLVATDPNSALYRNRPSISFLATCPDASFRDAGRAVDLARALVGDGTQNGRCWQLLGVAHYEAGQYSDAITALQKSRRLRSGGDRFDRLFLAMAYWQLGEEETARQWYAEANSGELGGPQVNSEFTPLDFVRFRAEAKRLLNQANQNGEKTLPQPSAARPDQRPLSPDA